MNSSIQNKTVTLKDLMTEDEFNTYTYSKNLNDLYNSKKKHLSMIGMEMSDNSSKLRKTEMKHYKVLLEKHKYICELLYR